MKTIYYLALSLLLFSCGAEESTNSIDQSMALIQTEDDDDNTSCDCFVDDVNVTSEGVFFWEVAWFNYYGIDTSANEANQLFFSGDDINDFQNYIPADDIAGYRVYYGLTSLTDTLPLLMIIPFDSDCKDLYNNEDTDVLISTLDGSRFTCSIDSASFYTGNWQEYNSRNEKIETIVNAYNYGLSSVNELLEPNDDGLTGLYFEFGLRTLAPQETCFDINEDTYGSIAYCNLVYGASSDIENGQGRMDFAMPCPQMCDSTSPLSQSQAE